MAFVMVKCGVGSHHKELTRQPIKRLLAGDQVIADQDGWVIAQPDNDFRGNVVVLRNVDTGPLGIVKYEIIKQRKPKVDANGKRIDVAAYAVQVRVMENNAE